MTTAPTSAPPKPRLALTVGIIGHRPNRLPKDADGMASVEKAVADVLAKLHAALRFAHDQYADGQHNQHGVYRTERPLISLASALAEGADRIAARAAIAHRDYTLDAPLPFLKEEYEKDFEPRTQKDGAPSDAAAVEASRRSIEEFHDLIRPAIARSVLELPGARRRVDDPGDADANKAYEAVGLTILGQADILLTIWDGGASHGRGGTPDMLNAAARLGVPIIHVDAKGIVETCLRWSGLDRHPHQVNMAEDLPHALLSDDVVRGLVVDMVKPPEDEAEREALDDYLGERRRPFNGWLAFPVLMWFFGVRGLRKADLIPVPVEALTAQLVAQAHVEAAASEAGHPSHLALAFGWADAIATRFGQVFRSAFVTNFLFAALAVATVAVSLVAHDMADPSVVADLAHHKIVFVSIEILFIIAVLLNTMIGRRYGWHRRWLESREVAERLRVALPLWTLGARPGFFFGPEPAWTGWYVRAVLREQGLRSARFDGQVLRNARDTLLAVLTSQRDYHALTAARMDALGGRIERVGEVLFGVTLVAAVGLLVVAAFTHWHVTPWQALLVTALAAGLPALATASYGIRVIGDFEGVAHRSHRTCEALETLIAAIESDWPEAMRHAEPPNFALLRARAHAARDAMLGDVETWRLAAESRDLAIPG